MTWVTTVTRNLLVDHFRKGKYDRVTDSLDATPGEQEDGSDIGEQLEDQGSSPEQRVQSQQTQKMVQEALQKLSPELREAVILRDLQDLDYKEIAHSPQSSRGNCKKSHKSWTNGTCEALATYLQAGELMYGESQIRNAVR